MISILLCLIGVAFELIAFDLLYGYQEAPNLGLILILHFSAAVVTAAGLTRFLKKSYTNFSYWFLFLLAWLIFFVPGLGMLAAWIMASILIYFGKRELPLDLKTVSPEINISQIKPLVPHYGAGGARLHLLSPELSTESRTKALVAIRSVKISPLTNLLMQELLPDNQDEIRLLAFALLSQQQQNIGEKINSYLVLLENTKDLSMIARLQKNVAMLYWQIIYLKLLPANLEPFILQMSVEYAQLALKELPSDAVLWILLGKNYSYIKDFNAAKIAFKTAFELNAPISQVLPYLAEIDFYSKEITKVKTILNSAPTLLQIPVIGRVAQFWGKA